MIPEFKTRYFDLGRPDPIETREGEYLSSRVTAVRWDRDVDYMIEVGHVPLLFNLYQFNRGIRKAVEDLSIYGVAKFIVQPDGTVETVSDHWCLNCSSYSGPNADA